jgi:predicted dehydrogenase
MTNKARIAVIGTGWWATSVHLPALLANPSAELAAICDADAQRLQAAAQAYSISHAYTNHHEMLEREQIDGAIIATPHATHYPLARDCLSRGLHVLIEKPMTLYAAHARDLVLLAREQRRELLIGYPWNYTRPAIYARELLASGALGAGQLVTCVFNSYCIDLFRGNDHSDRPNAYRVHGPGTVYSQPQLSGGGHGHLQLTHSIGLMSFVSGLRPRRVIALMQNHGLPVDLVDAITVEFEGGAIGILGGTSNARPSNLDLQIHCAGGAILIDMVTSIASIRRHDGPAEDVRLSAEESPYPSDAPSANLVDIVLGRGANGSPAEPGWRTVELLDAAYRSAQAGGQPIAIGDLYHASAD